MNNKPLNQKPDSNPANRDPISGAPGAHPIGTSAGAAAGGLAGGVIGSMGGPIGTVAGAAVGAVAGGLAGKAAGEAANPTQEDAYWRANFASRPYAKNFQSYDDVAPAYQYGWESASAPANKGRSFDDMEGTLRQDWDRAKGASSASWDKAKVAVKDAWHRVAPGRNA